MSRVKNITKNVKIKVKAREVLTQIGKLVGDFVVFDTVMPNVFNMSHV